MTALDGTPPDGRLTIPNTPEVSRDFSKVLYDISTFVNRYTEFGDEVSQQIKAHCENGQFARTPEQRRSVVDQLQAIIATERERLKQNQNLLTELTQKAQNTIRLVNEAEDLFRNTRKGGFQTTIVGLKTVRDTFAIPSKLLTQEATGPNANEYWHVNRIVDTVLQYLPQHLSDPNTNVVQTEGGEKEEWKRHLYSYFRTLRNQLTQIIAHGEMAELFRGAHEKLSTLEARVSQLREFI